MDYSELIERQRAYFASGATRPLEDRRKALGELRRVMQLFEDRLLEALEKDLNKQAYETYLMELSAVYDEIRYFDRHLKGFMKNRRAGSIPGFAPVRCYMSPEPYGVTLIVAPWNYPVNLSLMPLVGAIAAGNCAVVKCSARAPHTGAVLAEMIASAFPDEYIAVLNQSKEESEGLLRQKWDYIFFTGSREGGRQVMAAAAENFIPVTLELGGKNPVVIDPTANLKIAARRIAFGKCINAGQTCIAPDYVLIHESVQDAFVAEYEKVLKKYFRKGNMSQMAVIVDDGHFQRLTGLLEGQEAAIGGEADAERRFIPPTVLKNVSPESDIMQQEIFGPILPLVTWTDLNWCMDFIHAHEKPLALYVFTEDKSVARRLMDDCSFGGGCVNDTMLQAFGHRMGFGGVGASGIGQYHGKKSFETFTHYRAVVERGAWPEQRLRHFPFGKIKYFILRQVRRR